MAALSRKQVQEDRRPVTAGTLRLVVDNSISDGERVLVDRDIVHPEYVGTRKPQGHGLSPPYRRRGRRLPVRSARR